MFVVLLLCVGIESGLKKKKYELLICVVLVLKGIICNGRLKAGKKSWGDLGLLEGCKASLVNVRSTQGLLLQGKTQLSVRPVCVIAGSKAYVPKMGRRFNELN